MKDSRRRTGRVLPNCCMGRGIQQPWKWTYHTRRDKALGKALWFSESVSEPAWQLWGLRTFLRRWHTRAEGQQVSTVPNNGSTEQRWEGGETERERERLEACGCACECAWVCDSANVHVCVSVWVRACAMPLRRAKEGGQHAAEVGSQYHQVYAELRRDVLKWNDLSASILKKCYTSPLLSTLP